MESLNNPTVIWMLVGLVFFLLEFALPGFILFFFAVAAWIVGLLSLFVEMSINMQLFIFLLSSLLTILFFRKWVKNIIWKEKSSSELEDEFIGKSGKAETAITPGMDGKVSFKGTSWNARSKDLIAAGETVIITGNESILLIVKSIKTVSI